MRIFAISVLGLLVVLAVSGCNPVGMENTRVYVRGCIYTDSLENTPAEGIGVATTDCQESYVTMTDTNGSFLIEIQFYPDVAEGGSGGSSGSVTFGLMAYDAHAHIYFYGGDEDFRFTVFGGDTLTMYDINLDMFALSKSDGR